MKKNILHTNKESGFKLPKDYFEGLEDKILTQAKLSNIEASGFKTPDSYFESLEDIILNKVTPEKNSSKVISLFSKKRILYISSVAAAILLLFNLSVFDSKPTFDTLDTETVENYIFNENINSYEIASLLTDEDLKEENFIDYNLSNENVENYILDNLDIETIILE